MACPVSVEFGDSTSLYEYESTELVRYLHSLPRLGISKDLEDFLNGEEDSASYLFGVCVWSIVLSIILTIYLIVLYRCGTTPSSAKRHQQRSRAIQRVNLKRLKEGSKPQDTTLNRGFLREDDDDRELPPDPPTQDHHQQQQSERFSIKSLIYEKRPPINHSPPDMLNVNESVLGTSGLYCEDEAAEKEGLDLYFEGVVDFEEQSFPATTTSNFLFQDDATDASVDKMLLDLQAADPTATLPQSKFISRAASRKRLLESYFTSLMNTSTSMLTWNVFGVSADPQTEYPALATTPPPPPSKNPNRKIRVGNYKIRPRQAWTFAQVFASPREEHEDGSAFQPQKKQRNFDNDSSIESSISAANQSKDDDNRNPEIPSNSIKMKQLKASPPKTEASTAPRSIGSSRLGLLPRISFRSSRRSYDVAFLLQRFRILTVVAGSILLLSTMLLITKGIVQLDAQADSVANAWKQLQWSSMETSNVLENLQALQPSLLDDTAEVFRLLDQYCPAIRLGICNDDEDLLDCNIEGIPLERSWESWLAYQMQPQNVVDWMQAPNWTAVQADLELFSSIPVEETLDNWSSTLAASTICSILQFVLVFLIMWSIAMPKYQFDFQEYFISTSPAFPWLFWLLTLASWIFAIVFLLGSIIASDACVESPATVTATLFFGNGTNDSDYKSFLPTTFWEYYLDGCPLDVYPSVVQTEVSRWAALLPPTNALNDALKSLSVAEYDILCTADGSNIILGDLQSAISDLSSELCEVTQTMVSLREMLQCQNWYPHYQTMAYESACQFATDGIGWAAMTQWIVVLMSLTIWTFRESFRTETDLPRTRRHSLPVDWTWDLLSRNRRRQQDKLGKFPSLEAKKTEESTSSSPLRGILKPTEQESSISARMDEKPSDELASPMVTPERARREKSLPLGCSPKPATTPDRRVTTLLYSPILDDEKLSNGIPSVICTPDRSCHNETVRSSTPRPTKPAARVNSIYPAMDENSLQEWLAGTPDRSYSEGAIPWTPLDIVRTPNRSDVETPGSAPELAIPEGQIISFCSVMDEPPSEEVNFTLSPDLSRHEDTYTDSLFPDDSTDGQMIAIISSFMNEEPSEETNRADLREEEQEPDLSLSVGQFSGLASFVNELSSKEVDLTSLTLDHDHSDEVQSFQERSASSSYIDELSSDEITL